MKIKSLLFLFFFLSIFHPLKADYLLRKGKLINKKYVATMSAEEHLADGLKAMENGDSRRAIRQFRTLLVSFPAAPIAEDAQYYLGIAYFNKKDYDMAHRAFAKYIDLPNHAKYLEASIEKLYAIATFYAQGAKKHLFGIEDMPQWVPAKTDAALLYDDIVAILPHHPIAAHALYSKGILQLSMKEFRESHDSFQMLLRRFPSHELVSKTYLEIAEVYYQQALDQANNPDILDLATLNLKKFKQQIPRDKGIVVAEKKLQRIKELFADELLKTAKFFEKTSKPKASVIYYAHAVKEFPQTPAATFAKERLQELQNYAIQLGLSKELWK